MFFTSSYLRPITLDQAIKLAPAIASNEPKRTTSDKYLFVPTYKMLEGLINNGWSIVSAAQSGNRKSSNEAKLTNKHAIMLIQNDMIGKNFNLHDEFPMLKIENSHNGLSSFRISNAIFRKVCANGLTVPQTILSAPKVKHTINMRDEVIEASYKVIKEYPLLIDKINTLKSINLTLDEQYLLADSAKEVVLDPERVRKTEEFLNKSSSLWQKEKLNIESQLLTPKRWADKATDLWTITNRIQENAIRGNVRLANDNGKFTYQRKVSSIDKDTRINEACMTLAAKMAKIKTGQRLAMA